MHFWFSLSLCMLVQTEKIYIPKNRAPPEVRAGIVLVKTPKYSEIAFFGGFHNNLYFNDLWSFDIEDLYWKEVYTISEILPCNF